MLTPPSHRRTLRERSAHNTRRSILDAQSQYLTLNENVKHAISHDPAEESLKAREWLRWLAGRPRPGSAEAAIALRERRDVPAHEVNIVGDRATWGQGEWLMRDEDEWRRRGPFPQVSLDEVRDAAAAIAQYPGVQAVYLFGSRAGGRVRPSSDIDLAVWIDPPVPAEDRISVAGEMAWRVEKRLAVATDVVLITRDLSPGLLFGIFRVEKILWARDGDRAHQLACRARLEYRDELPRLERSRDRLSAKIKEMAGAARSA